MKKLTNKFLSVLLSAAMAAGMLSPMGVLAEDPVEIPEESIIVAEGTIDEEYGNIYWSINEAGELKVTGTGDVKAPGSEEYGPWWEYYDYIHTAEIDVTGMTDASWLFFGCNNLYSIDLSEFDSSDVVNMSEMFAGCNSLQELDLSSFDTSNVECMVNMFNGCE